MVVLLIAITIMAIMMTVAMPVWKQMAQREKEEELVFRGMQYAHAIALFQRKFANAAAPSIDILVEQRFLRKKYKDPITNDDFQPLTLANAGVNATTPGGITSGIAAQASAQGAAASPGGRGAAGPATSGGFSSGPATSGGFSSGVSAGATTGIIGVVSKSKEKSIRLYNGRSHYNEWAFVFVQQQQAPGVAPGSGVPGAVPGQRGQQPGLRGQQPNSNPFPAAPFPGGPGQRGRGQTPAGRGFNDTFNPTRGRTGR